MPVVVEHTTRLAAPASEVWGHVSSFAGVNAELHPFRMSAPADVTTLTAADVPLGRPWFTSVVRLGPVPVERHRFTLQSVEDGQGFVEESSSLFPRRWRHERTIRPLDGGCEVTDRLTLVPRVPGTGPLSRAAVGRIFARRHAVLATRFGRR
jgi:hypothetical protein